ncbi:DNA-processing protein DprA [Thiocapsa bogorovii]|uniref:DNA-processing protein DprA n=1 Tax=Thiocapsa bogorovii TaxID=521689 RepID=UPI001E2DEBDD|nr:DNA-processing protein DprA [Thiocapsa bogorovii]UHD15414.1 DNA-processing protein DprA [Thiocapsa bogorovii]
MSLTTDSIRDWIVLISAPGIGSRTAARLLERYGSPRAVAEASRHDLAAAGISSEAIAALKQPDGAALERILAWADQPDACVLTRADARYPPLLAEIPDAPLLLYVRGDPELLAEPQLAVVGSRNPTPSGLEITRDFARRLAADGLLITSGLALGVDGAAHAGALEAGRTIAVLGTGPDLVYPATHRELARRVAERGALVTEFPPGQGPSARNFPRRNRIISGLSVGVLVTEAALKSGSLITARFALEQGRDVFAVPGSIRNPLSRGSHALIRDGAKLVEDPAEILLELAPMLRNLLSACSGETSAANDEACAAAGRGGSAALGADYRALLDAMGFDPVSPDELIASSGRSAREVSSMLLVLELEGHVSSAPGGRFCRLGS